MMLSRETERRLRYVFLEQLDFPRRPRRHELPVAIWIAVIIIIFILAAVLGH